MSERDKYLTEAMGECWHEWKSHRRHMSGLSTHIVKECLKCDAVSYDEHKICNNNFSTPEGFFKLWNWAIEQEWWDNANKYSIHGFADHMYDNADGAYDWINPDNLANAIYEYLTNKKG